MRGVVLIVLLWIGPAVHAQKHDVRADRILLRLGDSKIGVVIHTTERPGLTYVRLHDDEVTAAAAALAVLRSRGGRLVELRHSGERNISFGLGDTSYTFDPNRIFTPKGVDSTLLRHGFYSVAARNAVRSFADSLLDLIGFGELATVVAVHNNSPERLSAKSYAGDGAFATDARAVFVAADSDADDFFFVTTDSLYSELRTAGYNVVLQNGANVTDDGSLSVLSSRFGIPYVNVEAEKGHLAEQISMLVYLDGLLLGR